MTTLGLDVSPLRIGWAVVCDHVVDKHGTITFGSDEWVTPGMRAEAIEGTLDVWHVFDRIGLEAVFVGPNKLGSIRAAMALGQVESICDYLWPDAHQKILTAAQWRRLANVPPGGKESVMQWAIERCKADDAEKPTGQDSADAIAIAVATDAWHAERHG